MSGWNITCINQSSDNTVFLLFIDNRKLSETGSFYTNVFYRSAVVGSHGGRRDISIDGEVYGVCGSADEPLKPKTSVRDAQPTQSPLQPSPGEPNAVACRADINNLSFSDAITTMSTLEAGEIGIQVDSFFSDRLPNAFIGYGKMIPGNEGFVTPVLTTKAFPGTTCKMSPKPASFVAHVPSTANEPSRGIICSADDFGSVASIDFTGQPKGKSSAEVTLDDAGNFGVKYYYAKRL